MQIAKCEEEKKLGFSFVQITQNFSGVHSSFRTQKQQKHILDLLDYFWPFYWPLGMLESMDCTLISSFKL